MLDSTVVCRRALGCESGGAMQGGWRARSLLLFAFLAEVVYFEMKHRTHDGDAPHSGRGSPTAGCGPVTMVGPCCTLAHCLCVRSVPSVFFTPRGRPLRARRHPSTPPSTVAGGGARLRYRVRDCGSRARTLRLAATPGAPAEPPVRPSTQGMLTISRRRLAAGAPRPACWALVHFFRLSLGPVPMVRGTLERCPVRVFPPPHSQPRALRHTSLSVMRHKKSHKVRLSRRLNASTSLGAHHPCTPPTTSGSSGRARPVTIASQVGLSCAVGRWLGLGLASPKRKGTR